MRTERLNEIFSTVKPSLVPLIQAIAASSVKKSYKAPEPLQVCNATMSSLVCAALHCIALQSQLTWYTTSIHFHPIIKIDASYSCLVSCHYLLYHPLWLPPRRHTSFLSCHVMLYDVWTHKGGPTVAYWQSKSFMCWDRWEDRIRFHQVRRIHNIPYHLLIVNKEWRCNSASVVWIDCKTFD